MKNNQLQVHEFPFCRNGTLQLSTPIEKGDLEQHTNFSDIFITVLGRSKNNHDFQDFNAWIHVVTCIKTYGTIWSLVCDHMNLMQSQENEYELHNVKLFFSLLSGYFLKQRTGMINLGSYCSISKSSCTYYEWVICFSLNIGAVSNVKSRIQRIIFRGIIYPRLFGFLAVPKVRLRIYLGVSKFSRPAKKQKNKIRIIRQTRIMIGRICAH